MRVRRGNIRKVDRTVYLSSTVKERKEREREREGGGGKRRTLCVLRKVAITYSRFISLIRTRAARVIHLRAKQVQLRGGREVEKIRRLMILFSPWRPPFFSSRPLRRFRPRPPPPRLPAARRAGLRDLVRIRLASSLRVSNLFFARVEIPPVRGVSSYRVERDLVRQERKCKSGLGG
jgi:hypothetical protein